MLPPKLNMEIQRVKEASYPDYGNSACGYSILILDEMIELWKNKLLECHRCTLNIQRPFLEATNAKAEIGQSGRWFIVLSTFTLRTIDVIKQIMILEKSG